MNGWSRHNQFRPARLDDADLVIDLVADLNRKVGLIYGIRVDVESSIKTIMHVIERGVCVVGQESCAGGFIHPYPWNHEAKVGTILFWNYRKPSGIHVFTAICEKFKSLGATHVSCSSHFPENRAVKFYTRFELIPSEIQFIANLTSMKTTFTPGKEPHHVIAG